MTTDLCWLCETGRYERAIKTQEFEYGLEGVVLQAVVPVFTCDRCGDAFTDGESEDIRAEAVRAHLAASTVAMEA